MQIFVCGASDFLVYVSLCIMADDEKLGHVSSCGADWEVVALTTSAYATTSEPDACQSDDGRDNQYQIDHEPSSALFMSQHFVFPPHEHENLPIQPAFSDIRNNNHGTLPSEDEPDSLEAHNEETWEADLSSHYIEFEDDQTHCSYHTEIDGRVMIFFDGEYDVAEPLGLSNQNSALYQDDKNCMEGSDCNKSGGSNPPCEAWWKRHAISLYKHAKETHSFWSIFMAAALMGLVVLGQQWKKEKVHLRQFKWQFSINNEKMSRMLESINRFRGAIVGGHRRSSLSHGGAASNF